MTTTDDKIAALEREIEKLKAAQPPTPRDAEAERKHTAEYANEVHQMRERAANSFRFSPQIQRAMNAAWSDADLHDIARHGTVQSQSQVGPPQVGEGVRRNPPGDGTGWKPQRDFGADGQHPTPGVRQLDEVAKGFDRRERAKK
jgi:hypothetical protein